ncbi:MAG: sigma-70 family RNA polymerase sigma factor [Chloroflexota bacterium]|nr:sigma-70 family RNA polymerase sigma factor [Chloroflexota bacterium]
MTSDCISVPGPLADHEDSELVSLAASGDARGLAELYDRYSRIVMSFSLRMLADPASAEELTQEVFFRAWRQADAYNATRGTFATWILSITHNMAIDEIRKQNRRPKRADLEDPVATLANVSDTDRSVEDYAWLGSLREEMREALGILPAPQRRAIELAYFRGLTQREVAETLNEPLGTIKTRMRLGMRKLRNYLEEREVELT